MTFIFLTVCILVAYLLTLRKENKIEESFRYITDFTETEKIFERALEEPVVGIELLEEKGQILGLGLAWGEEKTEVYSILPQGFVTEDYLIEKKKYLFCFSFHSR